MYCKNCGEQIDGKAEICPKCGVLNNVQSPTNEKNNQVYDEIRQSRVWEGYAMKGTWDGNGIWNKYGKWSGNGIWKGGMISGTWDGNGEWEELDNGKGKWKFKGNIVCNLPFAKHTAKVIAIVSLISLIIAATLKLGGVLGWNTTIMVIVVPVLLSIVGIVAVQQTTKGKMLGDGTWKDDGEFRILTMKGEWKLGFHNGIIRGEMKDPKAS